MSPHGLELRRIGRVESSLTERASAPKQGHEGAPDAWLVFEPDVLPALDGIRSGDRMIVLTWLDRADRGVLRVHPRDDPAAPEQGVFGTRSPDRPNPVGLHEVEVIELDGERVHVQPLEALDGTPIVDLKPVIGARSASLRFVDPTQPAVRCARPGDAEAVGRLLHDFNSEYDEPTPGPKALAARVRTLLRTGDTVILLAGDGPDGVAVLRFREAIWTDALECYLAELYVAPPRRGRGLGRELMEAALELARATGATYIDLGTGEDDRAARALYESLGFSNRGGRADGPLNFFYEREL